jgi:hypothetical protein
VRNSRAAESLAKSTGTGRNRSVSATAYVSNGGNVGAAGAIGRAGAAVRSARLSADEAPQARSSSPATGTHERTATVLRRMLVVT